MSLTWPPRLLKGLSEYRLACETKGTRLSTAGFGYRKLCRYEQDLKDTFSATNEDFKGICVKDSKDQDHGAYQDIFNLLCRYYAAAESAIGTAAVKRSLSTASCETFAATFADLRRLRRLRAPVWVASVQTVRHTSSLLLQ
jgi:hypothetical protein